MQKSNEEIELSVVVLCYHAENIIKRFVAQLINEISELQITYELILVANYDKNSIDNTPALATEIAKKYPNIVVLAHEKEGGMGWDMRSGLSAAVGKYIAVIDGDAQMPASDIPIVYGVIKFSNYDLVKTYRAKRYDGIIRSTMSSVYNILFRILYSPTFPVRDINSKPKIFKKTAFQKMELQSNDWFTDAEIMIQAFKHKLKIAEISTVFYKNERKGSFVSWKTVAEFIINLFQYRFK
ncbi:MAG TPA: glycosyltransferase family 2 protein [Chitinophagales bacterium]|nr:glycosyltransferase family 2 protein [Chitinophagales bacterium]HMX60365.1 glycosyltransferase family 2 protein [Chitinophagales bacterium]HMZ32850.1 glycosyltransferase family 2 protein [Chitinophagales bacterium]HNA38963.1 glycosyltransferase family 2 protein [Chitinophagales bacterium]HNB49369.1 glycosyltransferase family 2 protein [Chitinophagales bacterium]